jgi:hypothetical protein
VRFSNFNVSERYYVPLLPQYPLDYYSIYAKRLISIITHVLVRRTGCVHSIRNLPSATRASSATCRIPLSQTLLLLFIRMDTGQLSGEGRILQAGNAFANTRDILHVEEKIETEVPQTAQIVWLGVRERSCRSRAINLTKGKPDRTVVKPE